MARGKPFGRTKKNRLGLYAGIAVAVLVAAYIGLLFSSQPHVAGEKLTLTEFLDLANNQRLLDARILDVDSYVVGAYDTGTGRAQYNTPYLKENRERLLDVLINSQVPTTIDQQNGKRAVSLASIVLPGLLLVVLFLYLVLSYRRGTGLFGMGSGARRMEKTDKVVTFADVAGQDAAVAELREVSQFLAEPERFTSLGAAIPKGILLFGPPGCGKTLMARALAGEAGASFWSISGSDFVELYVGVGAARVRDLFRRARETAPAIVFIDELDTVGRSRAGAAAVMSGSAEQEQALNQILAEMDGFTASLGIIVVAATNRPDVLDPALLRPGRFDRSVGLERPDEAARAAILALHGRSKKLAPSVDLASIASKAIGLTGADLAGLLNEAALLTARLGRAEIGQPELQEALQRLLAAPERQRRLSLRERSIGRRFVGDDRVTFADVAGADDAVDELSEIKEYLAEPARFVDMGARIPRGVLLSGPPGCGKTLLARALAGEANAAFFSVAASEFAERLVGQGAARVREVFAEARALAPSILFIDEIDSMGGRRSASIGSEEHDQTLNQLLVEMDGFEARDGVIVVGATNRPDLLDPALLRPGRFDRHVTIGQPDRAGRLAVLQVHARGKALGPDVDLETVAGLTRGFSGADLANVLNEATLLTGRRGGNAVAMATVEEAIDRTLMGATAQAALLSDDERRIVAYHEAGHALVARGLPTAARPHKLTLAGRGSSLGHCTVLDRHDRVVYGRSAMVDQMAVALGGLVAETLAFSEASSASGSDLRRVGEMARHMVRQLGMSDALGPLDFPETMGWPSTGTTSRIEDEARLIAEEARQRAETVLGAARQDLDRVAYALLERETLSASELDELLKAVD